MVAVGTSSGCSIARALSAAAKTTRAIRHDLFIASSLKPGFSTARIDCRALSFHHSSCMIELWMQDTFSRGQELWWAILHAPPCCGASWVANHDLQVSW